MNNINVNFLRTEQLRLTEQAQQDKKLFKYAALGTGALCFVFALIFGINQFLAFRINRVEANIDRMSNQISGQKQLEAEYLFFVDKLKIIRELFELRQNKQLAIEYFSELFPEDVEISGIKYDVESGILSLRITSPHVFRLEDCLEILEKPEVLAEFKGLNKTALQRKEDATYSFNLIISLTSDSELLKEGRGFGNPEDTIQPETTVEPDES